jgi:hypothetical protein
MERRRFKEKADEQTDASDYRQNGLLVLAKLVDVDPTLRP